MVDFKIDFIKKVENDARRKYRKLPAIVKDLQEQYNTAKEKFEQWKTNEYVNTRVGWHMYKNEKDIVDKIYSKLIKHKNILEKYTEESYVEEMHKYAEDEFNSNTNAIAARINEKNIDIDNLVISEVGRDPKYFEMLISDGKQKFYARSILAAEFSEKMIPHFRFIITDRSKY